MKHCEIVWDGNHFNVPAAVGTPREDQLASTNLDNLSELSGKLCYDALGTGRNSADYHAHIIEVAHGSVYEHPNLTFLIPSLNVTDYLSCCESLLNRPGVYSRKIIKKPTVLLPNQPPMTFDLRITANARAIREWFNIPEENKWSRLLGETVQNLAKEHIPLITADIPLHDVGNNECRVVKPETDEEVWVSLLITNVSRGLTHELVRHKYNTGVSQRSSRYVDENESDWCYHPLLLEYWKTHPDDKKIELEAKNVYSHYVIELQKYLISKGSDKFTARKQARGAARGFLGNALFTELIFSANIKQWKWMFHLRASRHADAEIRVVFNEAYELLSERFPDRFYGWTKSDCPDGIGYELIKPK